jgi:hypothetical protein
MNIQLGLLHDKVYNGILQFVLKIKNQNNQPQMLKLIPNILQKFVRTFRFHIRGVFFFYILYSNCLE